MNTTEITSRTLGYKELKTYWIALAFVAGNIILPQLCHLMPMGGLRWLPIYFFTLVASCRYGWKAGLITAILSPLVNSALFGMPPAAALPAILLKSTMLAAFGGIAAERSRNLSIWAIAAVVIGYQLFGTLGEWAMGDTLHDAFQDFRIGLPGILVQIIGGWAVVRYILK